MKNTQENRIDARRPRAFAVIAAFDLVILEIVENAPAFFH